MVDPRPEDRARKFEIDAQTVRVLRRSMLLSGLTTALAVSMLLVAIGYRLFREPITLLAPSPIVVMQWIVLVGLPLAIVLVVQIRRFGNRRNQQKEDTK